MDYHLTSEVPHQNDFNFNQEYLNSTELNSNFFLYCPYALIVTCTLLTNVLLLVLITTNSKLKSNSYIYVFSMSVSNIGVAIGSMLPLSLYHIQGINFNTSSDLLCTTFICTDYSFRSVSLLHFVLIGYDRYSAFTAIPRRGKESRIVSYKHCITIWFSVFLLYPTTILLYQFNNQPGNLFGIDCHFFPSRKYYTLASATGLYSFPIVLSTVIYTILIFKCVDQYRMHLIKATNTHTRKVMSMLNIPSNLHEAINYGFSGENYENISQPVCHGDNANGNMIYKAVNNLTIEHQKGKDSIQTITGSMTDQNIDELFITNKCQQAERNDGTTPLNTKISNLTTNKDLKAICTISITIATFLICSLPFCVALHFPKDYLSVNMYRTIHWVSCLHSLLHPLLYLTMDNNVKLALKSVYNLYM